MLGYGIVAETEWRLFPSHAAINSALPKNSKITAFRTLHILKGS